MNPSQHIEKLRDYAGHIDSLKYLHCAHCNEALDTTFEKLYLANMAFAVGWRIINNEVCCPEHVKLLTGTEK